MDVYPVADEVQRRAGIAEQHFHRSHGPDAGVGLLWKGEHVIEVRRVPRTRIDGPLSLLDGGAGVRDKRRNSPLNQSFDHRQNPRNIRADGHRQHLSVACGNELVQESHVAGHRVCACAGQGQKRPFQMEAGHVDAPDFRQCLGQPL